MYFLHLYLHTDTYYRQISELNMITLLQDLIKIGFICIYSQKQACTIQIGSNQNPYYFKLYALFQ